jgi:hypothetical protein
MFAITTTTTAEYAAQGVTLVGVGELGVVAESHGMRYYLTPCCGASAKGLDGYIGCRSCYEEVDPRLGAGVEGPIHSVEVGRLGSARYPYRARCSCGWESPTYVAEHAAQGMAEWHLAGGDRV